MPSEKVLKQKQESVAQLKEKLTSSVAGVLVDYKGITVADDTKLRRELREAGVEYTVLKNSILRFAVKEVGLEEMEPMLVGTTALATCEGDHVAAARILSKYADGSKGKFSIKCGFVEGKYLDAAGVSELAKLPTREVLIAKALGGLNAPISGFVNVLNANIRGLVVALGAIADQKSA